MLDFRVKKPRSAVNWRYQEIIVTEEYLAEHADDPNLITLDFEYDTGLDVLDVYFNGSRLTEGGGYEEVDNLHLRLDLRTYDNEGNMIPTTLQPGDEIVIKEWFNTDSVLHGISGLTSRLTNIEVEVKDARKGFPKLVDKITDIDRELSNLLGEGNYQIEYVYDPSDDEDVVREVVSGDYVLTREFTYSPEGKPLTERITHGNKVTTRSYIYDPTTGRISKVTSQTVTI